MNYSVVSFSEFGQNHNPIWHLNCTETFSSASSPLIVPVIVPAEHIDDLFLQKLSPLEKQMVHLQFSLQQLPSVRRFLSAGVALQIWLDQQPNQAQIQELISLKNHLEIVLVPFERFNISETTELLVQNGISRLTLLFLPKQTLFDGLHSVTSLFQIFTHLQDQFSELTLSTFTLLKALPSNSPALKLLCFIPSAEHYEYYLKEESRWGYYLHRTADATNRLSAHLVTDILVSFVQSRRNPNVILMRAEGSWKRYSIKAYWFFYDLFKNVIFHSFINGILLYPFYKVYWFVKFQYEKRFMKKNSHEV